MTARIFQHRPAEARSAQRVEHHDAFRGDDKARIRGVARIAAARHAGMANGVEDIRPRDLCKHERLRQRCVDRGGILCRCREGPEFRGRTEHADDKPAAGQRAVFRYTLPLTDERRRFPNLMCTSRHPWSPNLASR